MARLISPPRSELKNLRQPLTEGEWMVLDFFDRTLPPEWEIYVQPHLNGMRPDFVLLNPVVGIAVFEVKDWDLSSMDRWMEQSTHGAPELWGRRDGRVFCLQRENPVEKVLSYRREIKELYCPRLDRRFATAVVTAGIIFPMADDEEVLALLQPSLAHHDMDEFPHYNPISGARALRQDALETVFPEAMRTRSRFMTPSLAQDLRLWLVEPDAPRVQRTPLELDEVQRRLVTTRTASGFRRITGPAGSGKSLVLAGHSAELVKQGKSVMVMTYNITLLHYLMDSACREHGRSRLQATWLNFHAWCSRVCQRGGRAQEYASIFADQSNRDTWDEQVCDLVERILDGGDAHDIERFDAILVDEGQDFTPRWWNLIRKVCREGGEMVLAADTTQDIYGKAPSWTDMAMRGAGFTGDWVRLRRSYRLPQPLIPLVRSFGDQFLPQATRDLPPEVKSQGDLQLETCSLMWIQTSKNSLTETIHREVWRLLTSQKRGDLAVCDITVLVNSHRLGLMVVESFHEQGVRCLHTFSADPAVSRALKHAFYMGDARIKVTTPHSFKGWESRAVVLAIDEVNSEQSFTLAYAGMTRLKTHQLGSMLTVVCADEALRAFGETWSIQAELAECTH